LNAAANGASSTRLTVGDAPTVTTPAAEAVRPLTAASIASSSRRIALARSRKSWPPPVSETPCGCRTSNVVSSERSRSATRRLSDDWEMFSRAAAPLKLRDKATSVK
jgi:hypothetical protein